MDTAQSAALGKTLKKSIFFPGFPFTTDSGAFYIVFEWMLGHFIFGVYSFTFRTNTFIWRRRKDKVSLNNTGTRSALGGWVGT